MYCFSSYGGDSDSHPDNSPQDNVEAASSSKDPDHFTPSLHFFNKGGRRLKEAKKLEKKIRKALQRGDENDRLLEKYQEKVVAIEMYLNRHNYSDF